jgi:hypothetical protein
MIAETVKQANGVRFNGKHSFYDYQMFLSLRPDTGVPEPDIVDVEVPGANGSLDYTEAVTGNVVYGNREMTFDFVAECPVDKQAAFKSRLLSDLHGQFVEVELDEDAGWIYSGRAKVAFENVEPWKLHIIVTVSAYPYKVEDKETEIAFGISIANATTDQMIELKRQKQRYGIERNSYFFLRAGGLPYADISTTIFQNILVTWDSMEGTKGVFYIKDADGNTWRTDLIRSAGTTMLQTGNMTSSVDMSKIAKITINNIPGCRVFLVCSFPAYKYFIENGDMPAVPLVEKNSTMALDIFANNTQLHFDASTQSRQSRMTENFVLLPGMNEVLIRPDASTPSDATCVFRFKRGAL